MAERSCGPPLRRRRPHLDCRFLDDLRQPAQTYAGAAGGPPVYVTLVTEFQTYACTCCFSSTPSTG
jgi:hypothetical protein